MPYRKVSYLEQLWYILKYKLRERLHRKKEGMHAEETEDPM